LGRSGAAPLRGPGRTLCTKTATQKTNASLGIDCRWGFTAISVDFDKLAETGNSIVLIPKTADRWAGLFAALDEFPRDFVLERRQYQPPRADLDKLFDKTTMD
jgi:hypothetical protein